jgi:hypothetical protein
MPRFQESSDGADWDELAQTPNRRSKKCVLTGGLLVRIQPEEPRP